MTRKAVLITGAAGEIGHALIQHIASNNDRAVLTLDVAPLDPSLAKMVELGLTGSIMDKPLLENLFGRYPIDTIFHLAALLSTRSEQDPIMAHQVNVEGTLNLLDCAQNQGEKTGPPVLFIYPSSIAVYGLPDLETKQFTGKIKEDEWNRPSTMYGCNKLYCELLGRYYTGYYKQLAAVPQRGKVDFRALRFPGLISALTVPSGGTSDYAPEMIHAAARGEHYACFVGPDRRIPFMAMPDAIEALLQFAAAPRASLRRIAYNLGAFNPAAEEIRRIVLQSFPDAQISYAIDPKRQAIVDSWPADVDDSATRRDWGFRPHYDFEKAFSEYLIPAIRARYR
jgi:nucleoside-diphosphate-sugar epimerase